MAAKTKTKMWYRARGCQHSGICKEWEGSIMVPHMSLALGTVVKMSKAWNIEELYYIALYMFDSITGEMDRTPVIWQSYDDDNNPLPANRLILPTSKSTLEDSYVYEHTTQRRPMKDAMNAYDDADWCEEFEVPVHFVTLKPMEQESE